MAIDEIGAQQYQLFCQFLEQACGIVLGDSKQYLVRSRLSPLIQHTPGRTLNDYIELVIKGDQVARRDAVEVMTTNETLWFRDGYPFNLLESELFAKLTNNQSSLKIWSAACSSGQEAYSIGMCWLNYIQNNANAKNKSMKVIGTDISSEMLHTAKLGEYDHLATSRGLPAAYQSQYFDVVAANKLRVKAELKQLAEFKPINLLSNYHALGRFDIVFCRNVLIYFSAEVKKQILQKIAACLQDGGILFLGASESLSDLSDQFIMVRSPIGLYYQKKSH